jgi:prepilin-type N-terminal cleavage/methylation domain-containing protein
MHKQHLRHGFTMLEIVFAITILGIVGSISSKIIVQVYSAYLQQRTVHNASIKTELAINQLANRLTYRIDRSVVARQPGQTGNTYATDLYPLREVPNSAMNSHRILEWIGYDNDSFSTDNTPAWSGYCDIDASTFANLNTPGSSGGTALAEIETYYGAAHAAIVFAGYEDYRTDAGGTYTANCMYSANGCIFPVNDPAAGLATFTGGGNRAANKMIYTEFYRLAVSAFSVVPVPVPAARVIPGVTTWDLHLHYGYQPWENEHYMSNQNNDSVLLRNVSVFRFIKETNNIRIKLCVVEQVGQGANDHYSVCKEKAVIR